MSDPKRIYELLLDSCDSAAQADDLMIGLVWTLCRNSEGGVGLAMSPAIPTRTLSWPGSLKSKPLVDLAAWILQWDPYQATVAMAAINSCLNSRPLPESVPVEQKNRLSEEMERWYSEGNSKRFPKYTLLEQTHKRLSHLDSSYKPLWDRYAEASSINMN